MFFLRYTTIQIVIHFTSISIIVITAVPHNNNNNNISNTLHIVDISDDETEWDISRGCANKKLYVYSV